MAQKECGIDSNKTPKIKWFRVIYVDKSVVLDILHTLFVSCHMGVNNSGKHTPYTNL